MTGSLSFARVEPVAEVDTCRGKSTAIKLRHPDTCHIRDFSGSLRLSAPLTHIRGEGSGGPSLPPSDVSKCFPCESQWQLSLSLFIPTCWNTDHAERFQTRRKKA